jgi:hypothetical protein
MSPEAFEDVLQTATVQGKNCLPVCRATSGGCWHRRELFRAADQANSSNLNGS